MLPVIFKGDTHTKHVNIVRKNSFSGEVHGLRLGVTVLNVGFGILEVPWPNDDQVTFSHPLATTHLSGDPSHACFTVCTEDGDAATTQDFRGQSEHLVHFLVRHFDTDFTVASVFRILKTCEFFDVHFFLKSATQSVSPISPNRLPFLNSSPKTGPQAAQGVFEITKRQQGRLPLLRTKR